MSEFWAMGGYGVYVWSSFGLSFVVIAYQSIKPWWSHRQLKRRLVQHIQEEQARESRQA